jgi:hypothetical protein
VTQRVATVTDAQGIEFLRWGVRGREGIAAPGEAADPQHQANVERASVDFSVG